MMSIYLSDSSLQQNIKFLRFAKMLFSSSRKNFIVYCVYNSMLVSFSVVLGCVYYYQLYTDVNVKLLYLIIWLVIILIALVCLAFTIGNGIEFYKDLKKQTHYIHKIENEINIFNNKEENKPRKDFNDLINY